MPLTAWPPPEHPTLSRRTWIQAGSVGLLGLGMNHLPALRAADTVSSPTPPSAAPPAPIMANSWPATSSFLRFHPATIRTAPGEPGEAASVPVHA